MGPRGASPLQLPGRGRIARSLVDFQIPTIQSFIGVSQTEPVLVAPANPFRSSIAFASGTTAAGGTAILLAPIPDALRRTVPAFTLAVGQWTLQPAMLSWVAYGALVTGQWWALALAANQNLFVTEQQYMG